MRDKLKIIVSGMVAGNPGQGGAAWAVLQYVLGLLRLGHDVYLIEPINDEQLEPASAYFRNIVRDFDLEARCSLLVRGTTRTVGLPYPALRAIAQNATVLLNVSGMLHTSELIETIPYRVYLDLDPAFNQLWQTQGIDMHFSAHNYFVTVGNAIGLPQCPIPTCDVQWITTFQPVILQHWPVAGATAYNGFTSIANWRGYGSIEHNNVFYGQKAHSLRAFIDLPNRTPEKFILALAIHSGEDRDLEALNRNHWTLLDPIQVVNTPQQYQKFVSGSKAEFGIAKSGYVASRCAWFSDRSACYLASGRPVLAQDTGFSQYLPCGDGLLSFSTYESALAGIESINSDYSRHARAARSVAVEYFDSDVVLSKLLAAIGIPV
jgi:hypothetical protein